MTETAGMLGVPTASGDALPGQRVVTSILSPPCGHRFAERSVAGYRETGLWRCASAGQEAAGVGDKTAARVLLWVSKPVASLLPNQSTAFRARNGGCAAQGET